MIVDFDDFQDGNTRLDLLLDLHRANPAFKCTLFTVPGCCSPELLAFMENLSWCELAVHGWQHPSPRECEHWPYARMQAAITAKPATFVKGFKAPGWQISDGCYQALLDAGWWVADHPENNARRPKGLRTHVLGDGDHWHGHIQNVCGNGLEETFPVLLERVEAATEFQWVSEVVVPW